MNPLKSMGAGLGLLAAAGLAVLAAPAPAQAACDSARYSHNGSLMEVHVCDGNMVIEYDSPRSGLVQQGVRPGDILFRGQIYDMSGGAKINGRAHVFKLGCKPASYEVNGWMELPGVFSLEGRAPVRRNGCTVSGHRNDILIFKAR